MAYDEQLAERVRDSLAHLGDVTEKRMFGGLAFLVGGAMAVTSSGEGGLMVRVGKERTEQLLDLPGVEAVVMRDRPMRGWVRVDTTELADDADLERWVATGVRAARAAQGAT